ncbi:MAG TPA: hypothetical protein VGC93_08390, partial [Thermoanaerobaculia bacterium]
MLAFTGVQLRTRTTSTPPAESTPEVATQAANTAADQTSNTGAAEESAEGATPAAHDALSELHAEFLGLAAPADKEKDATKAPKIDDGVLLRLSERNGEVRIEVGDE